LTLPFPSSNYIFHLLLKEFLPPITCKTNQPRPKEEHGGGFRHRNGNRVAGSIESLEHNISLTIATAIVETLQRNHISLTIATAIVETLQRNHISVTIATAIIESLDRNHISPTIIGGCANPTIATPMMMMPPHAISMICQSEYQNSRNNKFLRFHWFSFSLFLF
jgi:hypothetical protein